MREVLFCCSVAILLLCSFGCGMVNVSTKNGGGSMELYKSPPGCETKWISFENHSGAKGRGGKENLGAKGHAFDSFKKGTTRVLCDVKGPGTVRRMWITLNERDPRVLRGIRINMYWDNRAKPAVSAPFGDFFCWIHGQSKAFENALFSSPEGRSFVCIVPMPFRTGAKITITNESEKDVNLLFYDVDLTTGDRHDDDVLYFHAFWHRTMLTKLGVDFEILPRVAGEGRFLGCHIGVISNPANIGWWGEGEVRMFIDGDRTWPTVVGTGTEDYIGTGWGQGVYVHQYQGCMQADKEKRYYSFYRYHIPDPVYFHKDCRITIQQIGGSQQKDIVAMLENGVPIIPISSHAGDDFKKLYEKHASLIRDDEGTVSGVKIEKPIEPEDIPEGWVNYYRRDDVSAVAYFYLDRPVSSLPEIPAADTRMKAIQ